MNPGLLLGTALLTTLYFVCTASAVSVPNGHLLLLKDVHQNHYTSVFTVGFDGSVSQNFNYSSQDLLQIYAVNLFVVEPREQIIYIGLIQYVLAFNLTTGKLLRKYPLHPQKEIFFSYDYVTKENAIYGMSLDSDFELHWSRIVLPKASVENLFQLTGFDNSDSYLHPYVNYVDSFSERIWFEMITGYVNGSYSYGIYANNITTGKGSLFGATINEIICVAYDYKLNRTFTIVDVVEDDHDTVFLAEMLSKKDKNLMKLPSDFFPAYYGTCAYDVKTHTFIVLMANATTYGITDSMPTTILLIDVVDLSYKQVPLPGFKKWKDQYPVTGIKFVPTED